MDTKEGQGQIWEPQALWDKVLGSEGKAVCFLPHSCHLHLVLPRLQKTPLSFSSLFHISWPLDLVREMWAWSRGAQAQKEVTHGQLI